MFLRVEIPPASYRSAQGPGPESTPGHSCRWWAGPQFLRVNFSGASLAGGWKNKSKSFDPRIRPQIPGVPQNSAPDSGSGGAKSPLQTCVHEDFKRFQPNCKTDFTGNWSFSQVLTRLGGVGQSSSISFKSIYTPRPALHK